MKAKGKIFQIVKWEEKKRFFCSRKYGDVEVDLIHVERLKGEERWHDKYIAGLVKGILGIDKSVFKYEDISLEVGDGLPVLVERPHNFQVGDVVVVDITLKHGEWYDAEVKK